MASENAKIDNNYKKTLTAITDDVAAEIRRLLVDPTTGRLRVSAVITAGAITSLNGLTDEIQTFAVGTTGDDFNIVSVAGTHTFNIPDASATTRGLLTSADWTTFNDKQPAMGADDNYVTDAEKTVIGNTSGVNTGDQDLSGYVVGPASATDNAIPRYDATTGKLIQNSGIVIDDSNRLGINNTSPSYALDMIGWARIQGLDAPTGAAVSNQGTPGTTEYDYAIVTLVPGGGYGEYAEPYTSTGNATLDGTNFNRITWTDVPGAAGYEIWRTVSDGTPSSIGKIGTVAQGVQQFDDTGLAGDDNDVNDIYNGASLIIGKEGLPAHIYSPDATSDNTSGGSLYLYTGLGKGGGNGGNLGLYAGQGGDGEGNGGWLDLYTGNGGIDGNGGAATLRAGDGGTNGDGGNIYIKPGQVGTDGSYSGSIYLQNPVNYKYATLDMSSISSTSKTFTFPNLTGTFALQEYNSSNILSTTTGINAKTVATTNLYTVPAGKTAIITGVIIRCTTATAVTVVPTLGVGIAAGEADIMPSTALTGLDLTTEFYRYSVEGVAVTGAAAAVIKLGIDTGATATTMTIAVDLIGYLI